MPLTGRSRLVPRCSTTLDIKKDSMEIATSLLFRYPLSYDDDGRDSCYPYNGDNPYLAGAGSLRSPPPVLIQKQMTLPLVAPSPLSPIQGRHPRIPQERTGPIYYLHRTLPVAGALYHPYTLIQAGFAGAPPTQPINTIYNIMM